MKTQEKTTKQEINLTREALKITNPEDLFIYDKGFEDGVYKAKKEVLEFIEKKRKGNYVEGSAFPDLFDPAFCLSDLIKFLKGEK